MTREYPYRPNEIEVPPDLKYSKLISHVARSLNNKIFKERFSHIPEKDKEWLFSFTSNTVDEIKGEHLFGKASGLTEEEAKQVGYRIGSTGKPVMGEHNVDQSWVDDGIKELSGNPDYYFDFRKKQIDLGRRCDNDVLNTYYGNCDQFAGYSREFAKTKNESTIFRLPLIDTLDEDYKPIFSRDFNIINLQFKVPDQFIGNNGEHDHPRIASNNLEFIVATQSRLNAILNYMYKDSVKPESIYTTLFAMQMVGMVTPYKNLGTHNDNATRTKGYLDAPVGQATNKPFELTFYDYSRRYVKYGDKEPEFDDKYISLAEIDFNATDTAGRKVERRILNCHDYEDKEDTKTFWEVHNRILDNMDLENEFKS